MTYHEKIKLVTDTLYSGDRKAQQDLADRIDREGAAFLDGLSDEERFELQTVLSDLYSVRFLPERKPQAPVGTART